MDFPAPLTAEPQHALRMDLRWGDMDAMGHVNNTVYFRFMEQVRVDWLNSLGLDWGGAGGVPVIVNAWCGFLREMRAPGRVLVRLYAARPGRSSFETRCTIFHSDAPELPCAHGGAKVVWIDASARRSAALPPALRLAIPAEFPSTSPETPSHERQ